jgi:GNAT superfamily N-acetyltransferase
VQHKENMIRPARLKDYTAVAAIHNACWPAHPTTPENIARLDGSLGRERWVLEVDGNVVAQACLESRSETNYLDLSVHPEHQSKGFGTRFYAFLEPRLTSSVTCSVREDHAFGLAFAHHRGFREVLRSWHQTLEVSRFDHAPFAHLESRLKRDGYEIKSYSSLDDPDRERKLHALYALTSLDVPGRTDIPDFERYRARTLHSPLFLPDAHFIALKDGDWVAYTATRQCTEGTPLEWHTGMTGVLREHRARGLAVALKVRVIELARASGIQALHTNNAGTNAGILAVNARLGYVRKAAQIQLQKTALQTVFVESGSSV